VARITIEDCLKRVKNRFLLVNLASKRVRQIREGSEYLVVSLREIAAGKVTIKEDQEEIEEEKEEIEDNL
jgi:DNA-directed RNA polymerase subunit omega